MQVEADDLGSGSRSPDEPIDRLTPQLEAL